MCVLYITLTVTVLLGTYGPDSISAGKLPPNWPKCKTGEPDESACMQKAIPAAIAIMKDGVPSISMIPIEPLNISQISIEQRTSDSAYMNFNVSNVKVTGLSGATFHNIKSDLKNREIEMDADFKLVKLEGAYSMDGKFLVLPVKGNGQCTIAMGPFTARFKLKGDEETKKGDTYWKLQPFLINLINVKKFAVDFSNLFNGDKKLGDNMNRVLNENWELFYDDMKPELEKTFSEVFTQICNTIFSKVPEKQLFLE